MEGFTSIAFVVVSLVIGFALHEAGHAYSANYLGDGTSKAQGRLTLNPLKHLDPFGSVLLPLMLIAIQWPIIQQGGNPIIFAAAKPVPVNPNNFKRPFADFAFVAAAGPMVNIGLVFLGALALNFSNPGTLAWEFLSTFIWMNIVLAMFNLLPIPPLDGSKIIAGFLPRDIARQIISLDRIGFIIIIGVIMLGNLTGFDLIGTWILYGANAMAPAIQFLATLLP